MWGIQSDNFIVDMAVWSECRQIGWRKCLGDATHVLLVVPIVVMLFPLDVPSVRIGPSTILRTVHRPNALIGPISPVLSGMDAKAWIPFKRDGG